MMDGYDRLIAALDRLEPPLFLFGGFAEDVLFNSRPMHPHSDVDVLIFRDAIPMRLEQFAGLGYSSFDVYYMPVPGEPLVLHADRDGVHLEPSIAERDGERSWFVLDDPGGGLHRIFLPPDAFSYPPIVTDQVRYRIVSPLALYQIRAAIQTLGIFGELRPHDQARQETLRARFLTGIPDADLDPAIVPL